MPTEPPSLAARLEQTGPLPWREASRLAARIARTLDRLHAQSPAHGGIEPLTVLFVGGTVRLADPLPPESRHAAFVAPWVLAGEPADRRADFFALGRTIAAMLGPDPQAPGELSPALLPPPLLAVQRRLVEAAGTAGYGSGNDIAAALELAIAAGEGFAVVAPEPSPPSGTPREPPADSSGPQPAPDMPPSPPGLPATPRPRRRRPRAIAALVALLLVGGLAVYWLGPSTELGVERPVVSADPPPLVPTRAVPAVDPDPRDPAASEPAAAGEPPLEQVLAALPDLPLAEAPTRPATKAAVEALLAGLKERPCTRLEVEPTALGLRLVGSTSRAQDRTELLAAIGALEDIDKVTLGLDEAGRFCRLYDMLAAHAAPAMPRLANLFPARSDYRLAATEPLVLRVLTPDFPSHLAVDYFTADDMVVHLEMRQADAAPLPPVEEVWIGDPADGQWLTITEPFGHELITVIASHAPLFAEPRPRIEPAAVYLEALEAAFAGQPRKPVASTIAIETVPDRP